MVALEGAASEVVEVEVVRAQSAPTVTLPEAIEQLFDFLRYEANWSPNTTSGYGYRLQSFALWMRQQGHSLALEDFSCDVCREYMRHLGERLTAKSRYSYTVPLRRLVRFLADERLIPNDFSHRLTLPQIPKGLPKPVSVDELPKLLNMPASSPRDLRDRALVLFLLSTGCRISEALALNRSDIPHDGDSLYVVGKGNKERKVYLLPQAKDAVRVFLAGRTDHHPALFISMDRRTKGDRLTAAGAREALRQVQRRLGVWSLTSCHVLRHTTASLLMEVTNGNARLVAEVLGHADLRTVMTYTAVMEGRFSDAYAAYGERLNPQEVTK